MVVAFGLRLLNQSTGGPEGVKNGVMLNSQKSEILTGKKSRQNVELANLGRGKAWDQARERGL